jgi:hypothetical protein
MIDRLKKLTPAGIWLFFISAVVMAHLAAGMGMLLKGETTHDP